MVSCLQTPEIIKRRLRLFHAHIKQHGAEPVDVVDEEDAPDVEAVVDGGDVAVGDACHACAYVCHGPGAP